MADPAAGPIEWLLDDVIGGSHTLHFHRSGYGAITREIEIEVGATTRADVDMVAVVSPSSRLDGQVTSAAGGALPKGHPGCL